MSGGEEVVFLKQEHKRGMECSATPAVQKSMKTL